MEVVVKIIYEKKEIRATILKREIKELFYICTKIVYFSLNNEIHMQNKSVAIGFAMEVVLQNVFTVELERTIIRSLWDQIKLRKRYIGNRIDFVKIDEASHSDIITIVISSSQLK